MRNISIQLLKKDARHMLTYHHAFFAVMVLAVASFNMGLSYLVDYAAPNTGTLFNLILYFFSSIITNIVYYLIFAGYMNMYLKLCRYRKLQFSDLWLAFSNHPEAIAVYAVVQFIIHTVMSEGGFWVYTQISTASYMTEIAEYVLIALIAVILLIGVQLRLSMTVFVYCDDPYKSGKEILLESIRITKGHRGKLFCLYLSFTGVFLISLLSFGLGLVFVYPYLYTTLCLFYLNTCKIEEE